MSRWTGLLHSAGAIHVLKVFSATSGIVPQLMADGVEPNGVEPRNEPLNERQDAGMFDSCEIRPREVICSCETIASSETKQIEFDVSAETADQYTGTASSACTHDTAEQKVCTERLSIEIAK